MVHALLQMQQEATSSWVPTGRAGVAFPSRQEENQLGAYGLRWCCLRIKQAQVNLPNPWDVSALHVIATAAILPLPLHSELPSGSGNALAGFWLVHSYRHALYISMPDISTAGLKGSPIPGRCRFLELCDASQLCPHRKTPSRTHVDESGYIWDNTIPGLLERYGSGPCQRNQIYTASSNNQHNWLPKLACWNAEVLSFFHICSVVLLHNR
ncbi:hypothetical protein PV04_02564 [Phialophora macrospora]|uniref:Uncharacterized protein n=1 Tax=Phialophora macrospora TaxID=1851006 RepID=A0A0D2GDP7_9EURO|nr:hypothetical protein PV04_02564 [Phialophora macrospora]